MTNILINKCGIGCVIRAATVPAVSHLIPALTHWVLQHDNILYLKSSIKYTLTHTVPFCGYFDYRLTPEQVNEVLRQPDALVELAHVLTTIARAETGVASWCRRLCGLAVTVEPHEAINHLSFPNFVFSSDQEIIGWPITTEPTPIADILPAPVSE